MDMINLTIDNRPVSVEKGTSVLQAASPGGNKNPLSLLHETGGPQH